MYCFNNDVYFFLHLGSFIEKMPMLSTLTEVTGRKMDLVGTFGR